MTGILDKIIKQKAKSIEYRKGYDAGKKDGIDEGHQAGYAEAKLKYRDKDFYDPLGEEA